MDLRRFQALNAVVEEGSFVKAAARLCCTQSTVTFQIRQLEQELGLQLFEKVGRRMRLTEGGKALMPQVRELTRALEHLRAAARQEQPQGELRIAAGESLLVCQLPEILRAFRAQAPQVRLRLQSRNCYLIRDALLRGEADLGIFYQLGEDPALSQHSLGEFALALVASPLLEAPDFSRPDQKLPFSLISNEPQCVFRLLFENELRRRNIALESVIELLSIESIKRCVAANLGISYLPRFCVERELQEGALKELPFAAPITSLTAVCAHHVNKSSSPALRLFLDLTARLRKNPAKQLDAERPIG